MNKPIVLFDIDYTLFDTDAFKESGLKTYKLYDETEKVLKEIVGFSEIGIFSQGENDFQREKLKQTLIAHHFQEENVHIFGDKDINLINVIDKYRDSKIFLVDDKLGVLYSAKKHMSKVIAIWVKRGPFAKIQEPILGFKPDVEIVDLKEVVKIIKKSLEISN